MRRAMRLAAVIALAAAVLGLARERVARGDEKSVCAAKYQSAQRLRAAGKLTLARADLLRCAEQTCPGFVSNDCKTWLAELEAELPTLVYAVLGPDGRDVPDAVIRVDGGDVAGATDGLGHAIDPGEHVVEASANGQSLREKLVVRLGEKSRRVELRLGGSQPHPSAAVEGPPASSAPADLGDRISPAAYVLGGVGVLAIAAGTVLWVTGANAAQTYNHDCETGACTSSQRDAVQRQLVAGDVAWGVALAAGIGVVAVVLSHRGGGGPAVSLGPSGVSVGGTF